MTGEPGAARAAMVGGALWLDGGPRFLIAGEYPYYRDAPERWAAKLRAIRAAGIEAVTCYVPWRHHEVTDGGGRHFRFAGDGNRDLVGFLELVAATGLLAVPKPGPFVHAELPFGGLPDRLSPTATPGRQAALSADGEPLLSQRLALPSASDPVFLADARSWLRAVGRVLQPFLHPAGPVVAVQIGNEGHYGETALAIDALDYSPAGLRRFGAFAPGVEAPGPDDGPLSTDRLRSMLRWGEWSAEALAEGMRTLAVELGPAVPVFTTSSPPARADRAPARPTGRYDAWLARNRPGRPTALPRAYTSWAGNVLSDDEALVNYVLAAKQGRGPNIEENWGLGWVDPGCAFPVVPIHHALLGVACGATGIDVYPACATAGWGEHLAVDRGYLAQTAGDPAQLDPPYGEAAPIRVDGTPGPAFAALRVLTHFLAGQGAALVRSLPEPGITWGLHPPYAAVGAWASEKGGPATWAGRPLPAPAGETLVPFVAHCLAHNLPFRLAELTGEWAPGPGDGPLVVSSGFFMGRALQGRLARFADDGGSLLLLGELPRLDEMLTPCTELADAVGRLTASGERSPKVRVVAPHDRPVGAAVAKWLTRAGEVTVRPGTGGWLEFRSSAADPEDCFVFLFNRSDEVRRARTEFRGRPVTADLVSGGCAVVRISHGRLRACYVKGLDERTDSGVPVRVRAGDDVLTSDQPCDLSAVRRPSGFDVRTAGGPPDLRVTLPKAQ
ncbi:beta-galactosidase [Kitasatospora sp. NPDC001175]|uniref:beta-galactosidase n=1 Tax=Kitasatospora sp. NPDC001175 TaxID=3157103 RepID=UPI003CFD8238